MPIAPRRIRLVDRRWLAIAAAWIGACGPDAAPEDSAPPEPAGPLGAITAPLPGPGPQHHAVLACAEEACAIARQAGSTVRFGPIDGAGFPTVEHVAPAPPSGWNHPELNPLGDGWLVVAATAGAPHRLVLDAGGAVVGEPAALHDVDWPWGMWPDAAVGEDGRALAVWSDKITPFWRVFDPADPGGGSAETWELALDQATIDPPAVVPVPGGYVRAWTVKNGFEWQVRLLWVDLDGEALGDPVIAASAPEVSRGTRPQLAADADGNVAVAWRVWSALGALPEGAYLRAYGPDGAPLGDAYRLDGAHGDRPTVAAVDGGWLAVWEEGEPLAVLLQARGHDGAPAGEITPISEATDPAGRASIALRPDGTGFVSWEEVQAEQADAVLAAQVRVRPLLAVP